MYHPGLLHLLCGLLAEQDIQIKGGGVPNEWRRFDATKSIKTIGGLSAAATLNHVELFTITISCWMKKYC